MSVQLNRHILDSSSTEELCELIKAHAEEFDITSWRRHVESSCRAKAMACPAGS